MEKPGAPQGSERADNNEGQEWKDKYVRLYADFENFGKRSTREKENAVRYALEPIARELLEIRDSLEQALNYVVAQDNPSLASGLAITLKQLTRLLEKEGVARVDTSAGRFDPELQEASAYLPSEKEKGTIISVDSPGFTLHGRLIRPARVVVSAGQEKKTA